MRNKKKMLSMTASRCKAFKYDFRKHNFLIFSVNCIIQKKEKHWIYPWQTNKKHQT